MGEIKRSRGEVKLENNIFKFATKELSQDAFLAWLINWINIPRNEKNKEIKNLAKEFVLNIIKDKDDWVNLLENDEDNIEVKCDVQYYNIDVLVSIHNQKTDKYLIIIIEDKVQSLEHDSQIDRYRDRIIDNLKKDKEKKDIIEGHKLDKQNDILTCYYKPYDECGINLKKVDCIYVRSKKNNDNEKIYGIYDLFQKYKNTIEQEYFKDYFEYIKTIEDCANESVDNEIIEKRKYDIKFLAFFKSLETEFLETKKDLDEETETEYIGICKENDKLVKIPETNGERIYFDRGTTRSEPTWWCNIPIKLKIESDVFYKYAFIKINFYKEKNYTIMLKIAKIQIPITELGDYNKLESDKGIKKKDSPKTNFMVKKNNPIFFYYDKEEKCTYEVYNKYNGRVFDKSNVYEEIKKFFENEKIHLKNNKDFCIKQSRDGGTNTQPEMNIFTIQLPPEEEKSFEDIKEIIKEIKEKLENKTIIINSIEDKNDLDVKII